MSEQTVAEQPKLEIMPTSGQPDMLRLAIEKGAPIETIERLVAMMKEERAYQAEKEFNEALNAAQTEIERVAPDKDNKQTNSRYASYAALSGMVKPIYTKHGFSLSFDEEDSPKADHVRVVGILSKGGHTRRYHKDICADGKGAKGGDVMTRTHAEGAADSYGMRYLLKKIFDIAIGEEDDDGNLMPENQERDFLLAIEGADGLQVLERAYKDAITSALKTQDAGAVKVFIAARQKREKELRA
jgi:ERF superfamily protein